MNVMNEFQPDTIPDLLYRRAIQTPHRVAYEFPEHGQAYTWQMVWREVQLLAKGLLSIGIQKGDTVAMLVPGRIELILSMYAAACIGAISVPLNTYSKKGELQAYLADSKPVAMIVGSGGHQLHFPTLLQEIVADHEQNRSIHTWIPKYIFVLDNELVATPPFYGYAKLAELAEETDERSFLNAARSVRSHDPLILLFTSGTLASPKGVLRSTASFLPHSREGEQTSTRKRFSWVQNVTDSIAGHYSIFSLLPLYHMGGFGTIFSNLKVCNIRIVMLSHYNPVNAWQVLAQKRCQIVSGTPYMLQQMLAVADRSQHDLSSVLGVVFTSAAVSRSVIKKVTTQLQLAFFMVSYGSSEAGPVANGVCFVNKQKNLLLSLLFKSLAHSRFLSGLIPLHAFENNEFSLAGKVDKGVEVQIRHPQTGESCSEYEHGEIYIRSHRVMKYIKEQPQHSRYTSDGWYKSGDLGYLSEEGYLTITGRLHRIISRGGEKISPLEIEDLLLMHDAVEDALVFGVQDELYGEQICACIVTKPGKNVTSEQLRRFLIPHLSSFKLPLHYVFLTSLPLSPTGKISIADVRQIALEQIGGLKRNA